jgi:hypothetical protein
MTSNWKDATQMVCPHCTNDDRRMMESIGIHPVTKLLTVLCNSCSKLFFISEAGRHISENKHE